MPVSTQSHISSACTIAHGAGIGGLQPQTVAQAMAEGAILGLYRFKHYFSPNGDDAELDDLTVVEQEESKVEELQKGLRLGTITAEASCLARDMAKRALQRHDAYPDGGGRPTRRRRRRPRNRDSRSRDMEEKGMGAFVGVARGSHQPPKLIVLKYRGNPDNPATTLASSARA